MAKYPYGKDTHEEYVKYCNEDYPKDKDGEWSGSMEPGDRPGDRFSDGTLKDPHNSDHHSHPF